ncbi:putative plant self-incompatibility S1 [Helianthus annuus]|uniref:S-protein homolog n=1 Tax=Helianthus annuus TaxID=4232 RepID=A0A9K3N2S2_HELAN|nr:putative plant self-incompatibility S1 [Helianthus annuus]KAJ0512675.1 putative plant self-incompatibility S1 [Helianthus annuus]KAJ0520280.1 putative plant self-incompatibility S1 [Helianthus annuus]KAJ0528804.1 putative plant self-incompatibility S1 [Helianthus annuus]KAJ0695717.1 putative plant self-incompatibility S1 [Helianthus annuus]
MSIFVTNKLLSGFIILICLLITPSQSRYCYTYEFTVNFYDGVQDSPIDVHVKSKDDDLGHHTITYDHGWPFGFCEQFFERTLFWGDFTLGSQFARFNVFDKEIANIVGWNISANTMVYWLLKQDGYYLSKELLPYDDPGWMFRGHWQ